MSEQMKSAVKKLEFFMDINTPIICIQNHDFARFDLIIKQVAENRGLKIDEWNPTMGITDFVTQVETESSTKQNREPLNEFLNEGLKTRNSNIILLKVVQSLLSEEQKDKLIVSIVREDKNNE